MRKKEGRINQVMSFGVSLDAINILEFSHPFAARIQWKLHARKKSNSCRGKEDLRI